MIAGALVNFFVSLGPNDRRYICNHKSGKQNTGRLLTPSLATTKWKTNHGRFVDSLQYYLGQ